MERTEEEELRILRRVMKNKQKKATKGLKGVRVDARVNGIQLNTTVTIPIVEVPLPETLSSDDIQKYSMAALRHAKKYCEELGYKKVTGIRFTGKAWEATLTN